MYCPSFSGTRHHVLIGVRQLTTHLGLVGTARLAISQRHSNLCQKMPIAGTVSHLHQVISIYELFSRHPGASQMSFTDFHNAVHRIFLEHVGKVKIPYAH